MKTKVEDAFILFERLLNEDKLYLSPELDFSRICAAIGISTRELDAYVREELGIGGQNLMDIYRAAFPDEIKEKYGIEF